YQVDWIATTRYLLLQNSINSLQNPLFSKKRKRCSVYSDRLLPHQYGISSSKTPLYKIDYSIFSFKIYCKLTFVSFTHFLHNYTKFFPHSTCNMKDNTIIKEDKKSTRLNSSHVSISYAVFCLKKKKK